MLNVKELKMSNDIKPNMKGLNLVWGTFSPHLNDLIRNLYETKRYSDVTLVCDEQQQFKAHQFILSSSSSIFENIFGNNNLSNQSPFIYLRGINHQELKAIIQYIYLGETKIDIERLNEFLKVAKDLNIKDIGDTIDTMNKSSGAKDQNIKDIEDTIDAMNKSSGEALESSSKINEEFTASTLNENNIMDDRGLFLDNFEEEKENTDTSEQIISNNIESLLKVERNKIKTAAPSTKLEWICKICNNVLKSKEGLSYHLNAIHDEMKYPCSKCDYQGPTKNILKRHINIKHKNIKQHCNQCDYQTAYSTDLIRHRKIRHEGLRHPCDKCDYMALYIANLHQHKRIKHGIVRGTGV